MTNKQTILVTGGCGFIGSNFIRMLKRSGFEGKVVNVDAQTYAGKGGNLQHMGIKADEDFQTIVCGIETLAVEYAFKRWQPDFVVNFAAESHVDRSIEGPSVFMETNVLGTQTMLDMALKYGVKKFVQIGTDEVYGDLGADGKPTTEDSPLKPSSPYSVSKTAADLLALSYHRTHGMNVCVTRCSNNYGPYQFPEKLIPLMIVKAMNNEPLPVYAEGNQVRDWIHVEDHCRGVLSVLKSGKPGQVYNFGGDNEQRNIDVVKIILKTLAKPESLIRHVEDRKGHDFRYAINFQKAEEELGWLPSTNWEKGIMDTVIWYRDNVSWWLPLKK